jgi:hypothetical protein
MTVLTNVSPYFDDFDENKNFVRVLFKPGVAVQARELTQSQTILQNQIKSVGNFLFKDGSKVSGPAPSVNLDARTIRLKNTDLRGSPIAVSNFLNTYVTTATSEVLGYVEFVYEADDPNLGDPISVVISLKKFNIINDGMFAENDELYFYTDYTDALNKATPSYTAIATTDITKNAISTLKQFSKTVVLTNPSTIIEVGDLLVHPSLTKKLYVTKIVNTLELEVSDTPDVVIGGQNVSYVTKATNPTTIVSQDDSIFYKYGFFVKATIQKIVPDRKTAYPTKLVGYLSDQQIITSEDDTTLLDPAFGSSNYFATGADRLKIDLNVVSLDVNSDGKVESAVAGDIIPLLNYNKGQIEYLAELTADADLDKKLAERTYDESGSYVVNSFKISPIVGLETDTDLKFSLSEGKAYVGGLPVRTVGATEISVPKSTLTETKTGYNINTTQGNYFKLANVQYKIISPTQLTASSMFLELHSVKNPTNANTLVGTLAYKNIEYDSYIGGINTSPQYKLFYNLYSPVKEVPATWADWSTKYGASVADGQYIANIFYTSNELLGRYGPANTPYYGLFREPDTKGVYDLYNNWIFNNKDIEKVKVDVVAALNSPSANPDDKARSLSNTKSYLEVVNGSPFFDGLINVKQIRSVVGVANGLTSHGTAATYALPFFYADIASDGIASTGVTTIFDSNRPAERLVFPINKTFVKNVDTIRSEYIRVYTNAVFSSGVFSKTLSAPETFALGDGIIPPSTARTNFIVLVKSGNTANTNLGAYNFERGTTTIAGDSATLTINMNDPSFTGIADVSVKVENDDLQPRAKTLVENHAKVVNVALADYEYSLGKSDIATFKNLYALSNVGKYLGAWVSTTSYDYNDIVTLDSTAYVAITPTSNVSPVYSNAWTSLNTQTSSDYILDNGQRDSYYDHGTVKFISAANPPGNVLVLFDYFTHSGEGPITVQSYPDSYYSRIPTYRSVVDSNEFNLRDVIDFRPRRIDDTQYYNFDSSIIPTSTVNTEADVTYYLGRKDRIYVTNTLQNYDSPYNKFYVQQGVQSANPKEVDDISDISKLSLAVLEIPPYAKSSFDVKITYDDNKRFTMRDIGKIEALTINLDKAVKLQSIEIASLRSIVTNEQGDTLLKSGILVEDFTGTDKADLTSGYFGVAVDTDEQECFPGFAVYNIDLDVVADIDIAEINDLITMKYVNEVFASQLEANSFINVNPGAINDGVGRAEISKKNSFRVNMWLTGGLLLLGGIVAAKTIAAYTGAAALAAAGEVAIAYAGNYAVTSAYFGETVLSVAWGAVRDLGYSFSQAIPGIDSLSGFVSSGFNTLKSMGEIVSNFITGGSSAVVPNAAAGLSTAAELVGLQSQLLSSGVAGFEAGLTGLTETLGSIFTRPFPATLTGLKASLEALVSSSATVAFAGIAKAAEALQIATSGVPIVGAVTSAISAGAGAFSTYIAGAPFLIQAAAVVAVAYVAVKVVKSVWKGIKKLFSDERMKTNVKFVRKMPNGLNLYQYEYRKEFKDIAGHGVFEGYMAHEVEKRYPKAVQIESNGYKSVNYSLVGI